MLKMIIATSIDGVIGIDGKLPWHLKEDLQYFKNQTKNKIVVMGHTTFRSLPFKNGFPDRINYVLTRNKDLPLSDDKVVWINDISEIEALSYNNEVWIVGGAEIYNLFKDKVEEIHHTLVHESYKMRGNTTKVDMYSLLGQRLSIQVGNDTHNLPLWGKVSKTLYGGFSIEVYKRSYIINGDS